MSTVWDITLLTLTIAGWGGMIIAMVLSSRWNRRHGRSWFYQGPWREGVRGGLSGEEHRHVKRAVRSGAAVDRPHLAQAACVRARQVLHQWENPWQPHFQFFILMPVLLHQTGLAFSRPDWPSGLVILAPFALAALISIHASVLVLRPRYVARARRADALNRALGEGGSPP